MGHRLLIVGLGNPGREYENTRHNVGFKFIENWIKDHSTTGGKKSFSSIWGRVNESDTEIFWQMPQTFMNLSGRAVRELSQYYEIPISQIVAVHDELDLPVGKWKWGFDSGAAGHRGIQSMIQELGSKAFYRVRIGIGRPENKDDVADYVLSAFSGDEKKIINDIIFEGIQKFDHWRNYER